MLGGLQTGSGLLTVKTLQSIKAAGGKKHWIRHRADALRIAGEGVRQVLDGELVWPRKNGPRNIVEADEYIAAQGRYSNARGKVLLPQTRSGDETIDKRTVGSHYAPIGLVHSRDVAIQRMRERDNRGDASAGQGTQGGVGFADFAAGPGGHW